jgi:hypothetical protein
MASGMSPFGVGHSAKRTFSGRSIEIVRVAGIFPSPLGVHQHRAHSKWPASLPAVVGGRGREAIV